MKNQIKIACSSWMLPGEHFLEKFQNAARYGYDGVELRLFADQTDEAMVQEILEAVRQTGVKVSSLLYTGDPLRKVLDSKDVLLEKQKHAEASLEMAARFDCPTLINPECCAQNPLPMFNHPKRLNEFETELLCSYISYTDACASKIGAKAMIEPLNRYETHYYYTLDDAAAFLRQTNAKNVMLLADFFHLSIEEPDLCAAFAKYGKDIVHVHLGDNNRMLPGQGGLNFRQGFRILQECGYDRYMGLECGIIGDKEQELPACAERLKNWLEEAGAGTM